MHKAATETLRSINEYASTEDDTKLLAIVAQLTGPHGSMRFDALTKTKTIELILYGNFDIILTISPCAVLCTLLLHDFWVLTGA